MTTLYWQIAPELDQLRRQAERMLEDRGQAPTEAQAWKPAAELRDLGDRYELQLQLPGIKAENLDIQATQDSVTVTGDCPATEAQFIHSEFRTGAFKRAVRLPEGIQHQAVSADYSHGLLTLNLPKLTAAPDYRVRVAVNGSEEAATGAPVPQVAAPDMDAANITAPEVAVTSNPEPSNLPTAAVAGAAEAEDLWAEPE